MPDRPHSLTRAVGSTPLVELCRLAPKPGVRLFAKLEGQNPSGSIKDRIALAMVVELETNHGLRPGDTLVEASTGNTAIALAMVARQRGYHLKVVVPEGVVPSINDVLSLYGVEIVWAKPRCGMLGAIETADALARENGWFAVRQFSNPINTETHYLTTGAEIAGALPRVDVLVAGIGTGGTLMGIGRRLRETNPHIQLVGVEPKMGERLQGLRSMSEGFHPPLVDLHRLSRRFLVGSADALRAMRRIVEVEGIAAGVSSGAALHAALRVAADLEDANIVLMFSDSAWKYLPARPWDAVDQNLPDLDETHWW